ncbi:TonB-dependent receptor plug domain-containing protein [Microbulbifer yueqingensis]|uniref:Vitamin B12 transporter n=1 Tax=Microbulbifer yueqingensis TaxID=658219 RepID=A0A1G8Y0X1_9GAMM|nr:TonB-dependent receptor [Microbulbifer yueqingensis]SDJ96458.1 vitamin B12 transporter [Microbulbifer yueqingensis]
MNKTLLPAALLPLLTAATHVVSADDNGKLEQMSVTASRVEIPRRELGVSVSVVTAADIERLGYTSLLDIMRTLPGVAISNNGGAGKVSNLYLRGESNYRTLVLLDGVNIADPANTQVATQFQHLLANDIARIEVLRGPQGMMYGAGAGGVINIITKKADAPLGGSLAVGAGRYGSRDTSASLYGESDRWDYRLDLGVLETDGFNSQVADSSGERDGYRNRTASAQLGYQVTEALALRAQARHTDSESEFDGCFAGFSTSNNCLDEYKQASYRLSADYRVADVAHQLAVARQDIERDSLSAGASSFAVEGGIDELNYVGNTPVAGGELLWGAEYEQQEFSSAFSARELDSLGLFSEWRAELAGLLHYSIGVRRDRLENEDHDSWRSSIAYPLLLGKEAEAKLRASYGTGYRAPSPFELAYNIGEGAAPVGPETSRGYELAAEYRLAERLQVELVYFDQQIRDAIVFDYRLGNSGFGAYGQDDGESSSEGLELVMSGNLAERLDWYFNGTFLETEDADGEQRLQVPEQVYNLGGSYHLPGDRLALGLNWRHVANRLSAAPGFFGPAVSLDDYNRLDLKASYRVSDSLQLNLRGENILDEDYREVAGYNTAGAAVYAGLELTL